MKGFKFKELHKVGAGILAVIIFVTSIVSIPHISSQAGTIQSDKSNLLDGIPFDAVGKAGRKALYHYVHLNSVDPPQSIFCVEPSKHMWDLGGVPEIEYGINDNPPLIQSAEQFQELALTLQWCGNIKGGGKVPNDKFIVAQGAIWVIMENERVGSALFMNEMAKLKAHIKNSTYQAKFDDLTTQLIAYVQNGLGGSGTSSGGNINLPVGIATSEAGAQKSAIKADIENGSYVARIDITSCPDIKKVTKWTFPDSNWTMSFEKDAATKQDTILKFQYNGIGEPSGLISATDGAIPDSLKALLPKEGKINYLLSNEGNPDSGMLQTMVSGFVPTGNGLYICVNKPANPVPQPDDPSWQIYRHTETFNSHYNIDLEKYCAETGKSLQGSAFDVLEGFDSGQLGGSLDESCMYPEPTSWSGLRVCGEMTTDSDGHADHSDTRYYDYSKTYCTGHPEPELVECDHDGEEDCGCDEENERRMKQWEAECEVCAASTDFHDADGGGLQMMVTDRDQTYQDFINLEYEYTVEETQARNGYILHGLHNDDDPVETITTSSSEAGGSGRSRMAAKILSDTPEITPYSKLQMHGLPPVWNPASISIDLPTPVEPLALEEIRTVTGCDLTEPVPDQTEDGEETVKEENGKNDTASSSNADREETEENINTATDSNGLLQETEEEIEEQTSDLTATASSSFKGERLAKAKMATESNSEEKTIKGTASEADPEDETEEEDPEEEDSEEELQEEFENDGELINDLALTEPFSYTLSPFQMNPSPEGEKQESFLTGMLSGPARLLQAIMPLSDDEDDEEEITVTVPEPIEDNEPPVTPGPSDNLLYTWEIYDHRTEGELHINKRDLELYQDDAEGSYGKTQGDATLEGAVYGLYAADDIIHPDGKTGVVFKRNDLVAIATTDHNGAASFLAITEVSDTSKAAGNLAHTWIGHPLILGNYYVKEIARSEGYELSVSGIKELDTNRTGAETVLDENGTATASQLGHRGDNWDGSWNDFTVSSRGTTDGYDITVTGYPEGSTFYRVDMKTSQVTERVVTGSHLEVKTDELGNVIYKKADGGEYKIGPDGNYIVQTAASSSEAVPDTTKPYTETFVYTYRLNYYPTGTATPTVDPSKWTNAAVVDEAYLKAEVNSMLRQLKYKALDSMDGDGAPWMNLPLNGTTNAQLATEILDWYAAHDFWDCAQVESIYTKNGQRYARIFYDYTGLKGEAFYDSRHGELYAKKNMQVSGGAAESHYWICYPKGDYKLTAYTAAVSEKKEIAADQTIVFGEDFESLITTVYQPLYETYAPGELILGTDGNPIPETEEVFDYETETCEIETEAPVLLAASYDAEQNTYTLHVPNTVDWNHTAGAVETIFRAQAPIKSIIADDGEFIYYADYLTRQGDAGVSVSTTKKNLDSGTYIKTQVLVYPGQNRIYQDAGTRGKPIIVLQRIIKQAIKVTKDIAQESYDDVNTYKIHRDPFTVLFGGYNGSKGTKTLKNFFFRLYLKQDLIDTGQLERATASNATTEYNYEQLFQNHPEYIKKLAVAWDEPDRDKDGDLTTIHAEQGAGVDDYYGTSIPLPYGTYVLVEQQPTTIPTKHYKIDLPQEIVLPFVPQTDPDGTIYENKESIEYFYDSELTPEQLTARYHIRFNEETDVIQAHNNDGDFKIFKYGLEPDSKQDCGNAAVAGYYKYSSTSEAAGTADGVYYETYVDRGGQAIDYGITLDHVAAMAGKTTAVDRKYAQALVPWSVLKPIIGGVVNADGDIGNRLPKAPGGDFNFVSYANADMENMFFSSKIRVEKLDHETGENIIHDGALFKIYAAKRDVAGTGTTDVTGSGNVIFDSQGLPVYDEKEQIRMLDESGREVGIFKAYSTEKEVLKEDGILEKMPVGYIETYQPLGAGVYVLVEVQAPVGYAKSPPVAFEVYSDQVTYYEEGDPNRRVKAVKYQYMIPVTGDQNKYETYEVNQIKVRDYPSQMAIHKVESGDEKAGDQNGVHGLDHVNDGGDTISYIIQGSREYLEARGDVEQMTPIGGTDEYWGVVTKVYDEWAEYLIDGTEAELKAKSGVKPLYHLDGSFTGKGILFTKYVNMAKLSLYKGMEVKKEAAHQYSGVKVFFEHGKVSRITLTDTGEHLEITSTEKDKGPAHHDIWDTEHIKNPSVNLLFYDLEHTPTEKDEMTGELYILDSRGNRLCMADSVTGMAYVYDDYRRILVYPLDENGNKQLVRSIEVHSDGGSQFIYVDKKTVNDENGLPIYDKEGHITTKEETWISEDHKPHRISRLPFGAYIVEEDEVPYDQGYIQAEHLGIVLEDTREEQDFFFQNDFTKIAVAKTDITTKREIRDARLTLYEAVRVKTETGEGLEYRRDQNGNKIIRAAWTSGYEYDDDGRLRLDAGGQKISSVRPHWIDHIPVGWYILEETGVPYEDGYVRSTPVEIEVKETGDVQTFVMEDDYTQLELSKLDTDTGLCVKGAGLALYKAELDSDGKPVLDPDGNPRAGELIEEWMTGGEYTGGRVSIPAAKKAYYTVNRDGAIHIDYLPVGYYVLKETVVPPGYASAPPQLIQLKEIGGSVEVQTVVMEDSPLKAVISKTDGAGKEISGAVMEVYQLLEDGTRGNMMDRWITNARPHLMAYLPLGTYVLVEAKAPQGYLAAKEIVFTVRDTPALQWVTMRDLIPQGIIQVKKTAEDTKEVLAGAVFTIKNLTLNQITDTIRTGADGTAVSQRLPAGGTGLDGTWQSYMYEITEVHAPAGYVPETKPHRFQFGYVDSKTELVIVHWSLTNRKDTDKPSPPPPHPGGGGDDGGDPVSPSTPSQPIRVEERWEIPIIGKITAFYPSRVAEAFQHLVKGLKLPLPRTGEKPNQLQQLVCLAEICTLIAVLLWKYGRNSKKRLIWIALFALILSIGFFTTVRADEDASAVTITVQISTSSEADDFYPPLVHTDGRGREYKLKSWRTEPLVLEQHSSEEESSLLYERLEGKERIPEKLPVVIEDEETEEKAEGTLSLQSVEVVGEQWVDGFQFPVVFHRYDAQFYELEGYLIPYNDEKPALDGYESVLLKLIDAAAEDYQILDIFWDGSVYPDRDGILCRNAVAQGRKRLRDYEAVYRGEIVWPKQSGFQCTAEYVLVENVIPPTREETPLPARKKQGLTFWQKLRMVWAVTIALAMLIWLLCILFLWLEKKKQPANKKSIGK